MSEPTRQLKEYVHGTSPTERDRLIRQAAVLAPEASVLLDQLGIQPGWHVIDVGCGPVGILDLLAERVGPEGVVVGVEPQPHLLQVARSVLAERQLSHVQLVAGDTGTHGLPQETFDLAHARLLLVVVPNPVEVLAQIVALVRPGGMVAVQEVDHISWCCEPPHPAWDRLLVAWRAQYCEGGRDVYIGRRLPGLLRAAGLEDVDIRAFTQVYRSGDDRQTQLLTFVETARERILTSGLLGESELVNLCTALRAHLADTATIVIAELVFQAWGRKPRTSA
ncbi:MAG TPA: methyltransferase domain-containing protein [Chloroflexota bacterium]|jgi:SAM-dependent methyltransferase